MRYLQISFLRKMGGQIDELVSVSKRLRDSDLKNANVILDFAEKKVVKCIVENNEHKATFDELYNYYGRIYPDLIVQLTKEASIEATAQKPKFSKK